MAERLTATQSHPYPLQSQISAPGSVPSNVPTSQSQSQQAQPMATPLKDINAVNVCRIGQEMVHDIVSKAQDIFNILSAKHLQLNMNAQQFQERKAKLEENLNHINLQFRKLHVIHDKVLEISSQTEEPSEQQLVPEMGMEAEPVVPNTEFYSLVVEQHREIVEQVRTKNQQLKEIIDHIRTIIWEINTMITMRRT